MTCPRLLIVLPTLCPDDESDRPSIRVRVEKGCLVYGGDVQLFKNDPIIVTMARSDEQLFGTVAAIGLQEVRHHLPHSSQEDP